MLLEERVTRRVLRVYYDVYNELGIGFLESVYAAAFECACAAAGLRAEREAQIPVSFRGRRIAEFRADFLIESAVIVELKVARALDDVHMAQLLNYLRATSIEVGLLLNFGPRPEFRRAVLENQMKTIRVDPRQSAVPPGVQEPTHDGQL